MFVNSIQLIGSTPCIAYIINNKQTNENASEPHMEPQDLSFLATVKDSRVSRHEPGNPANDEYTLLERQGRGCTHIHDLEFHLNSKARKQTRRWPMLHRRAQLAIGEEY